MEHSFLIHHAGDLVGVAVKDIPADQEVVGVEMDTGDVVKVVTRAPVLLGHKVALAEINKGDDVIKYGKRIGHATEPIKVGDHVHTHNLRSARW
ncbi:MAG: hypothetical protein GEU71_00740 [Actinobacteria bacterium]|nr:hypothetical protein [Actinomycetota bacterium]